MTALGRIDPSRTTDRANRIHVARQLVRPVMRSTNWRHVHSAGLIAMVLALSVHRLPEPVFAELVVPLRYAMVTLAAGSAVVFDDPTRPELDAVPTSLAVRQVTRIGVVLGAVALWWTACLVAVAVHPIMREAAAHGRWLPVPALTLELIGVVAVAFAVAAVTVRRRGGSGALTGGGAVLVLSVLVLLLPARFTLFPDVRPGPEWDRAHLRWFAVAALGTATTAVALRDPARRLWNVERRSP